MVIQYQIRIASTFSFRETQDLVMVVRRAREVVSLNRVGKVQNSAVGNKRKS